MNNVWENIEKFEAFEIVNSGLAITKSKTITNTKVKMTEQLKAAIHKCYQSAVFRSDRKKFLDAFLLLSEGKVIFEISYEDVAREIFKNEIRTKTPDKNCFENMKDRVSDRLKNLIKWQQDKNIEFIRVLRKGYGTKNDKGQFGWKDAKIELVILSNWVQVQAENPESSLESNLEKLVAIYNVKMKNPKNN